MKTLSLILVIIAILILFGGFSSASGAPQEAVVVGLCCFIGILARIAQAEGHHSSKELKRENNNLSIPPSAYIKTPQD